MPETDVPCTAPFVLTDSAFVGRNRVNIRRTLNTNINHPNNGMQRLRYVEQASAKASLVNSAVATRIQKLTMKFTIDSTGNNLLSAINTVLPISTGACIAKAIRHQMLDTTEQARAAILSSACLIKVKDSNSGNMS